MAGANTGMASLGMCTGLGGGSKNLDNLHAGFTGKFKKEENPK